MEMTYEEGAIHSRRLRTLQNHSNFERQYYEIRKAIMHLFEHGYYGEKNGFLFTPLRKSIKELSYTRTGETKHLKFSYCIYLDYLSISFKGVTE